MRGKVAFKEVSFTYKGDPSTEPGGLFALATFGKERGKTSPAVSPESPATSDEGGPRATLSHTNLRSEW
jgi:hypothetical protein